MVFHLFYFFGIPLPRFQGSCLHSYNWELGYFGVNVIVLKYKIMIQLKNNFYVGTIVPIFLFFQVLCKFLLRVSHKN